MKSIITLSGLCVFVFLVSSCNKIMISSKPTIVEEEVSNEPPQISVSNLTVSEETGSASFTVSMNHAYASEVKVDYALTPNIAEHVEDFKVSALSGVLTFAPGERTKTIPVTLHNDLVPENDETIDIALSNATVGTIANANATMTITDMDANFFGADILSINQITGPSNAPVYQFTTGNTLYVDPAGGSGAYTTIQAAVNAATPGTQILVNTGVYPEVVTFSSMGSLSGQPIVLKANTGHSPVITAAEEIASGSLVNLNTDGEETAKYATGFENTTLAAMGFTAQAGTGNSVGIVSGTTSTTTHMGTKSLQISYGGSDATGMIYKTFSGWDANGYGGSKYTVRTAVKLASDYFITGTVSQGITLLRTETNGNSATQVIVKMFRTADPEVFTLSLLRGGSAVSGTTTITRGSWNIIEMTYKASTGTDGVTKLVVNGTTVASESNHTVTAVHDRFRLGAPSNSACPASGTWGCATGSVYYDDLRIEEAESVPALSDTPVNTIYENSFESGLGDFTSAIDSSNTVGSASSTAWDGSTHARMSFGGTSAQNSLRRTFTATNDTYARVAFRLNSAFDLVQESNKVSSPASTDEYVNEFDLLSLYNSSGSAGRLKVSILKRGTRFYILGKILNVLDESHAALSWASDTNIADYLVIYKGHLGEIQKSAWNTLEIRYAGDRANEGGVEIWLNGKSIAGNINNTTKKYDGLSTRGLTADTVQLGTVVDKNTGGTSRLTMQTAAPANGSQIDFDGLKVVTGGPAGLTKHGVAPVIYRYTYAALTTGESAPGTLIIGSNVLSSVASLEVVAPGTFYVDTTNRYVYFRMPDDSTYGSQRILSGRRNDLIKITNSNNIVIQNLGIQSVNNAETGCVHMVDSKSIRVIGNNIKGCNGPGVRVMDVWNASGRSSDILVSGNTFTENGKVFGGGVRIDHMGHIKIENNIFDSSIGNGIDSDCTYDIDASNRNETTNFCTEIIIARNLFNKSVESAIYLTSNTNDSRIYSNIITAARESGYGTQTTNGAWRASGGSGIHIARGGHNNQVYNNLVYNIDRAGIALRAAAVDNAVFNNTISETGAYIASGGASMDFQRDYNEYNDDHNTPTKDNVSFNNIFSYTYGTSPCVDLDGYNAGGTPPVAPANGPDETNMSNNNIFYNCARAGKYNATSYATLSAFVTATGGAYTPRESASQVFTGTLFTDVLGANYTLQSGTTFTSIPYDIKTYMPQ